MIFVRGMAIAGTKAAIEEKADGEKYQANGDAEGQDVRTTIPVHYIPKKRDGQ